MQAALTMDVLATDLADYLVRKGVSVFSKQGTAVYDRTDRAIYCSDSLP